MSSNPLTRRFFDSTRGQIILLLRRRAHTVAELVEALEITDNAIRTHLTGLERDGMVRQKGERRGFRKPHLSYELTSEAEEIFPKAYEPVLNALLFAIKEQYGVEELKGLLAATGKKVLKSKSDAIPECEDPIDLAVATLEGLGGATQVEWGESQVTLRGIGCPLSGVTADHEQVCKMVEDMLEDILGHTVTQACSRSCTPNCKFLISLSKDSSKSSD